MPETFDVIVVGAGGSGLAAAYSAAEHGGRVLVFEKRPQPGGTTGIAVGSFTAAGTSLQRQAGVEDNPEQHIEDAGNFPPDEIEARNADAMRAFFLREAATTFEWLRGIGLSFVGPSPEPPNRQPRMHNVVPGAKAYIAALQLGLQRQGAVLRSNVAVESLVRDGDRVVGVRAVVDGITREFLATRGVILAAGDYASNRELIARHKGEQYREIEGINPFATGDGHELAKNAGGKLVNMDVTYGPELRFVPSSKRPFQQWLPASGVAARAIGVVAARLPNWLMRSMIKRLLVTWQHPENALFDDGAILLNREGNRFVDETKYPDREVALAAQPGKIAYILLDGRLINRYSAWPHFISTAPDIAYAYVADYQRLRPDVTHRGTTLDKVARQVALDPASVRRSVQDYNASLPERGPQRSPLEQGPWVLMGPVKAYFTTTEGGAVVNQQMQVLAEDGSVIPGLYAVGQNGLSGMILWSHGLHIAWAMTSGRLTGIAVME
ncbi:MAG: FAD-dependent oxidoreductase [Pirellulaceae bacterium]